VNVTFRLKGTPTLKLRYTPGLKGDQGDSGTVTVGDVTTGAPGTEAAIVNTGTPQAAILDFTIPRGDVGAQGQKGWSPELAVVNDSARRVQQVVDWQGGEGTKPAVGLYVGATGLVALIADAIDIRGAPGASVGPGSIGTAELADGAATFAKMQQVSTGILLGRSTAGVGLLEGITPSGSLSLSGGALSVADDGVTNAKLANMAAATIKGRVTASTGDPEDLTGAQVAGIAGAVRYSAAQTLSAGEQTQARANIAALGVAQSGFRNLVINGDFRINQRAFAGGAVASGAYFYDRWRDIAGGSTVSVSGRVATISVGGAIAQTIEGSSISGGTYVINWVGTAGCTVDGVSKAKGATFTLTAGTNCLLVFFAGTVAEVQIECGTVPTQFEMRPYGLELMLCERFYQRKGESTVITIGSGFSGNTTDIVCPVPLSCAMRATPTLSVSAASDIVVASNGGSGTSTSVFISATSPGGRSMVEVYVVTSGTFTSGSPALLRVSAGKWIAFSAEL
jgi:hypothetical protein